jgi:4-amino-4-deoxy-L-arabinose transferase-like glycosyltransferase
MIKGESQKHAAIIFIGIFFAALALRCSGLTWGLPNATRWYSYHPDEAQMLSAILSLDFFGGDFNPDFFNYPSLYIYLSTFTHLLASGLGLAHLPASEPSQNALFMRDVLLSARMVTALLGAATAPFVYLTTRRIGGEKLGILAGLLMAFLPGHVQHSHFATVDVPATFFIALCTWLCVSALEKNTAAKWQLQQIFGAAFVAGLAAATKYNAGLILIAPLLAWLYLRKKQTFSPASVFAVIALGALGFFIGCPYAIFDFKTFWGDGQNAGVAYELLVHPKQGHGDVFVGTGNGWIYHALFNAPFLMTWPVLIFAVVGLVRSRVARRRETCLLFVWCALYFVALGFSQVRFMRYLLPLAPALCVFAALGVLPTQRLNHFAPRILGVLLLLVAAWGTRDVLYDFIVPDPRDRAAQWMENVGSTPKTIGMISAPWFYSPPLVALDSPPYRRLSPSQLSQLSEGKYQFIFTDWSAEKLQSEKPQWFILSEFEWREKARLQNDDYEKFMMALQANYTLEKTFQNAKPVALPGRKFVPHDFLYTNPAIRIYKRK